MASPTSPQKRLVSDLLQRIAALLQGDAAADPATPALVLLSDPGLLQEACFFRRYLQ